MSRLRNLLSRIKRAVNPLRSTTYTGRDPRPSLNDLDRKLERYLNFSNGFFIEAGANDGYSYSNTYFLEHTKGWRGILVEGIPELYRKCVQERKRATVYNCALVSSKFAGSEVKMHYAGLMSVVDGSMKTSDAQQQHLECASTVQRLETTYSVEVPARTLESILDEYPNLPQIDFLSLDVEGYELQVLEGLNLEKYRPQFILVEARFFEEVDRMLRDHYDLLEQMSHHDYFYGVRK